MKWAKKLISKLQSKKDYLNWDEYKDKIDVFDRMMFKQSCVRSFLR